MAEYLHQCGNINEEEKLIIQKDCTILHGQIYPDLKKDFMEADCFKTFPYLLSTSVNHCYCDM